MRPLPMDIWQRVIELDVEDDLDDRSQSWPWAVRRLRCLATLDGATAGIVKALLVKTPVLRSTKHIQGFLQRTADGRLDPMAVQVITLIAWSVVEEWLQATKELLATCKMAGTLRVLNQDVYERIRPCIRPDSKLDHLVIRTQYSDAAVGVAPFRRMTVCDSLGRFSGAIDVVHLSLGSLSNSRQSFRDSRLSSIVLAALQRLELRFKLLDLPFDTEFFGPAGSLSPNLRTLDIVTLAHQASFQLRKHLAPTLADHSLKLSPSAHWGASQNDDPTSIIGQYATFLRTDDSSVPALRRLFMDVSLVRYDRDAAQPAIDDLKDACARRNIKIDLLL